VLIYPLIVVPSHAVSALVGRDLEIVAVLSFNMKRA